MRMWVRESELNFNLKIFNLLLKYFIYKNTQTIENNVINITYMKREKVFQE